MVESNIQGIVMQCSEEQQREISIVSTPRIAAA
jgi:hypothetical protein